MWKAGQTDREAGYTYPAVLILLVAAALAAQSTSIPTSGQMQREREAELLFRGLAYRDAIEAYWNAGGVNGTLPTRLQDLVSDPRVEGVRHIRRLYDDPMPGGGWRIIQDPGGGITGVFSSAPGAPQRSAYLPSGLVDFKNAESYQDWRFEFEPTRE
jgi:type II secretory pathway pseudopilin PulG